MRVLVELEAIGYESHLEGEEIKLTWHGRGDPEPAQVKPLLENLKAHKREVVEHLKRQSYFEEMFTQALEEINRQYEPGTIPHIRENHPSFWQKIVESENRLGDSWLSGMTEDFKKALEEWRNLNLQAIEIFKEQGRQKTLFDLAKLRSV